ncbi:MAG: ComF family protein [Gammaproteobacteria bacterium]|nr:ComF family protein [Gammaproteobacteria bacterium]
MVYNWLKYNLLPARYTDCRLCSLPTDEASGLCPDCLADMPRTQHACPRCGAELANFVATACGVCQRHPPQYDSAHIPYRYAPPLIPFITGLKFHARLAEARFLAELFLSSFPATMALPECLIPVPLHSQRLRERGYNQALELARLLSHRLNLPIDNHIVQRRLHTQPQSELSGATRRRNMRHAFQLKAPVPYQHVALIDDVVTTGSTVNELARVLRQAGVENIQVWAIARA